MTGRAWHQARGEDVLQHFAVDPAHGLEDAEARTRLERHGPNRITRAARRSLWVSLLAQLRELLVVLLLAAAVVSAWLGEGVDVAAILAIVVLNAGLGLMHERKAQSALDALQELAAPRARVRRTGRTRTVPAEELVPGDIVVLESGDGVPADLRLLEAVEVRTQESALTGESQPVEKSAGALAEHDVPIAERRCLAWKGTLCVHGRAVGVVVATGMHTELGRIARLLTSTRVVETPLQIRLAAFARRIAVAVGVLCLLLFGLGLMRSEPPGLMLLTAVSLAVAAIPEALPAMSTVALSLAARRMARRNALVRHLPAVEALGSVTEICSDKTGTLTENRMRLRALVVGGRRHDLGAEPVPRDRAWDELLAACALNAEVERDDQGRWSGDPTEVALVVAAEEAGFERGVWKHQRPRVAELPFSSERGRMATVHAGDGAFLTVYVKGAPERVLRLCVGDHGAPGAGDFGPRADEVLASARALAGEGLRVLAVARRTLERLPERIDAAELERDLELLGLVAMHDPPRAGVREAIARCHGAGIRVAMVTGDHPDTALAIARELGILAAGSAGEVVTGRDLARLEGAALQAAVHRARVFARVAPEQKIAIVEALQARGEHVAMTGDGVNDAPALRSAHVGVAMGRDGTDVAREAASIVLLDDEFTTIVAAVSEGRRIDDNIRKFIQYTLTSNMGEIVTLTAAPVLALPLPLTPLQILWVNLVTDGVPGLALGVEPGEDDLMRRPPRPPTQGLLTPDLVRHIVVVGVLMGAVSLVAHAAAEPEEPERARTLAFTVLTLSQLGHVLAVRHRVSPLLSRAFWRNRTLLLAVAATAALQIGVLYLPWIGDVLGTVPLSAPDLGLCLGLALLTPLAVEIEKLVRLRRARTRG